MCYDINCDSYHDYFDKGLLLTRKLANEQRFIVIKFKSSLRKFYGRYHDFVNRYGIFLSPIATDIFHLVCHNSNHNHIACPHSWFDTECTKRVTYTRCTYGSTNCLPFRSTKVYLGFSVVRVAQSTVFWVVYCRSLYFLLLFSNYIVYIFLVIILSISF